jgi:hypothetical protein
MDRISSTLKARDMDACKSYDSCDEEEAAYRSGQLSKDFPWYNGGYPFDKIK